MEAGNQTASGEVMLTETPFELLFEADAGPFALDGKALVYMNELNLWLPPGVTAGCGGTHAVLRASLPTAEGRTPHPDVVGALVATLHALRPIVAARRMPTAEEQQAMRVDDRPPPDGLGFDAVVAAFGEAIALTRQPDGAFMAACQYERGSFLARLSWTPFDGFCFDALGLGDPSFPFDAPTLSGIAQLNARLPVGGFALWQVEQRGMLVFRRALPLLWLSGAAEEGMTLLSEDFVRSCLDNASGAWEAIEQLNLGGTPRALA